MGLFGCVVLACIAHTPTPELRGVWLTTTANDALASRANIARTMRRLKEIGFNTVYVEVWKNGYTQFPSQTLKRTVGVDRHPNLKGNRDLLRETMEEAHRNGLTYIAWFEYGFMAAHDGTTNELLKKKRHWMTTTREGKLISEQNPFVWMNLMRPESQNFLMNLMKEAVGKYKIDGVQLDDRIAWPTSMGYDAFTLQAYGREHAGMAPPEESRDSAWVEWRAKQVTMFAKRLHVEMRRLRPNLIVSISPAVFPWSKSNYACDWPLWLKQGWMTEFVPQVYRHSTESFAHEWRAQLAINPGARNRLAAGIMANAGDKDIPWEDLKANLDAVAQSGHGHVIWYSRAVLDKYGERLKAYYRSRGPARNPHLRPG